MSALGVSRIRHAAETVSQFREVAKVRRDAKQRLVFESRLRGVLIVLCAELKGVGLEIGVM